jgi:hypothetical protein
MIHQGTEDLSRGGGMGPATQGLSLSWVVNLHFSALEQNPEVLDWIRSWTGVLNLEVLSPEGWYTNGHKQGNFLWNPPPASADAAVEQLYEDVHKRPQCTHVFIAAFMMTNRWRKQMLKATDLKFFLKPECHIWDSSYHEPLGLFINLPLFRHEPWSMRYTDPVVELESSLRSIPCNDILQKGNILSRFLEQVRKLDAMPEGVVRLVLQGPEREKVPYQTTEGR